jgi:predicted MFS family arabinose efflux permease
MKGSGSTVAAAFALTAVSYGLARFAYGLLLPQIRKDLSLSALDAGWIGGGAFAAYCVGVIFASLAVAKFGERLLALLAGLVATAGVGLVAISPSVPVLGVAIALGGLSTGFTSPPLASAVARGFDGHARSKANGMINSGTAAGIVFSGFAVMAFPSAWRELYMLFTFISAAVTVWLWFAMPEGSPARGTAGGPLGHFMTPGLAVLCAAAFLMGVSSTAIWTFGADMLRDGLGFSEERIALVWITLGLGGLAGSQTGNLVSRFGIGRTHRAALLAIAFGHAMIATSAAAPLLAFAAMALFGAAYIVSSGVLLIWGTALLPDRPDLGLGIPFLAVAIGQTIGAPLFGALLNGVGAPASLSSFAAIACLAMVWTVRKPRTTAESTAGQW